MTTPDNSEPRFYEESLSKKHAENLSLYSSKEELDQLMEIAKRADFAVTIIPILRGESNSYGYLVVSADPDLQRKVVAEAPIDVLDFDDTAAQTSTKKKECWKSLEALGIQMEIIRHCDKIARLTFSEEHGEMYEAELDMRLLGYALDHLGQDPSSLKADLTAYRDKLLTSYTTTSELLKAVTVPDSIRVIFQNTRFSVELYPDTEKVLSDLHGENDRPVSNVIILTYGDAPFQFEKVLPLLKSGAVPAVFLTKAAKGVFLEAAFQQNPWKDLNISYRYQESNGKGINVSEFQMPIALTDDDPKQVKSVNDLAEKLGIPIEARRVVSPDQKRADAVTPEGELVIEIKRDEHLMLTTELVKVQEELFSTAITKLVVRKFAEWLSDQVTFQSVTVIKSAKPESVAIDFLRQSNQARSLLGSASEYKQLSDELSAAEALLQVRSHYVNAAAKIIDEL
jgi:hypothetical protein